MSQEFLDHIFDPFVQEKNDARSVYQGTGLGMTIVKGLIEQMHGNIEVTSEVGIGTTFVVEIPFEIAPPPEELPVKEAAPSGDIHGLTPVPASGSRPPAEKYVFSRQAGVEGPTGGLNIVFSNYDRYSGCSGVHIHFLLTIVGFRPSCLSFRPAGGP